MATCVNIEPIFNMKCLHT